MLESHNLTFLGRIKLPEKIQKFLLLLCIFNGVVSDQIGFFQSLMQEFGCLFSDLDELISLGLLILAGFVSGG